MSTAGQLPEVARPSVISRVPAGARVDAELRDSLSRWQTAVLALDGIDATTTELVRLRAAHHHDCHT
jgi:hypothetical protein